MSRTLAFYALVAIAACGGSGKSVVIARTPTCLATSEEKAFPCSNGTASRSRDTLRIRLATQQTKSFVNVDGEVDAAYEYRGRVGPDGYHLIERMGGEHPPYYLLIHPRSGVSTTMAALPVLSPDSTRFAAAIPEWDCAESPDQSLEIWRFADSIPKREWEIHPLRCENEGTSGFAAVEPVWRTPDTLAFVKVEQPSNRRTTALAVRDGQSWRLLTAP